jgi:hypothetical protein
MYKKLYNIVPCSLFILCLWLNASHGEHCCQLMLMSNQGIPTEGEGSVQLIKVACLVKKENNIFNMKTS